MATTTNFGWETPDDTDLVKDGAAAMRTLGNSIDTSFVDLKGGTSGQILSKASNTDLDYTWITNDVGDITAVTAGTGLTGGGTSGAVSLAIDSTVTTLTGTQTLTNKTLTSPVLTTPSISNIDAKGDLLAGTADNTIGTRSIGANGTVLTADSAEATGMKWAAAAGSDYVLINTYTMPGTGATYSVNSVFTSTYTNYQIIGKINNTSTGNIGLKLRASGTDSSASYSSLIQYWGITAGDGTTKQNGATTGFLIDNTGTNNWCQITLMNPQDAAATGYIQTGVQILGDGYVRYGAGFHNVATSYDGFSIVSGSNISGTFSVYGLKK
jgi:hypothetical protein